MLPEIKVLHLESTDVCQAACSLCARETDREFDKKKKHHLTIDQIQCCLTMQQLIGLDKMFMCGNYGDPAAGLHTLEIYQWFRKINPNITLGMNTNGAIQNPAWWTKLGSILNRKTDYVVFSIDGLEDTNHLYRVGVSWSKLMANAQAFISAGGRAHWDMLVYKHNQHQVDQAQELAKKLGFGWFRVKVSKRDPVGNLSYPVGWIKPGKKNNQISCHAIKEKSVYIDAQGRLGPCCWLGSRQSRWISNIQEVSITWNSAAPHQVCSKNCSASADNDNTIFDQQWQREVALC
jgi:MoaA/NifB/PqqE/SkfB family radical SAM enzyme